MKYKTINLDSQHYTETPEGFIIVDAKLGRVGIQQYLESEIIEGGDPLKVVNVFRPPGEVFCPDSLASMSNLTVTNDHPKERCVDNKTWKKLAVGFSEAAKEDGDFVRSTLHITDADAIRAWKSGKKEISLGYSSEDYKSEGIYNNEKYEYVQSTIIGNHIALVDKGRCGGACRTLDAEIKKGHGENMKIKIDGVSVEVADDTAATVIQQALEKRDAALEEEKKDAEETKKANDAEKEKIQAQIADLEEKLEKMKGDAAPDINKLVESRLVTAETAGAILGKEYQWKEKTDQEIKTDCVAAVYPGIKLDGESADYVDGLFAAAATAKLVKKDNAMGKMLQDAKPEEMHNDARLEYIKSMNDGGKK